MCVGYADSAPCTDESSTIKSHEHKCPLSVEVCFEFMWKLCCSLAVEPCDRKSIAHICHVIQCHNFQYVWYSSERNTNTHWICCVAINRTSLVSFILDFCTKLDDSRRENPGKWMKLCWRRKWILLKIILKFISAKLYGTRSFVRWRGRFGHKAMNPFKKALFAFRIQQTARETVSHIR